MMITLIIIIIIITIIIIIIITIIIITTTSTTTTTTTTIKAKPKIFFGGHRDNFFLVGHCKIITRGALSRAQVSLRGSQIRVCALRMNSKLKWRLPYPSKIFM